MQALLDFAYSLAIGPQAWASMAKLNECVTITEVGDLPRVSQSPVRPWMKAGKILLPQKSRRMATGCSSGPSVEAPR